MQPQQPDLETIRNEAVQAGALDPMTLRFRIVECDRFDGELLSVAADDISFPEALEHTANLARTRIDSHFYLEPVGFIQ
jgi:hypothetical protein